MPTPLLRTAQRRNPPPPGNRPPDVLLLVAGFGAGIALLALGLWLLFGG